MTPEERREKVFHMGITLLSDTDRLNRASSAANTCVFYIGKTCYVLDPAFGKKRRKELAPLIRNADTVHVLCTHYHNDHCANNGWVARKGSKIYYHHRIRRKIRYLRTNGTGQIRMMAREMELPGMLRRFKMFPGWMITAVLFSARISTFFPAAFLFVVSYLYSLKNIGRIRSGWLKAAYLTPETAVTLSLAGMNVMGWQVDDGLYAMEAPGHTDDHLVYYLASDKVLFAGDALNFLNGNDIQFGDIEQVHETLDFLHAFVAKEQVEVLFQGHYYPVFGTAAILDHIDTIRNQHREMYTVACSVIAGMPDAFGFDDALAAFQTYPSELAHGLSKITFPRSTLVFMDVYLLKVLHTSGYTRGKDRMWRRYAVTSPTSFKTNPL